MFESKLGTEKERDLRKIEGAKLRAQPNDRVQEKIVLQKKRKEYLDNYQYHETKNLKNTKPDTVIHQRWGDIIGGSFEEVTVTKTQQRGGSESKTKTTTTTTQSLRQNKSTANLKTRPKGEVSATKSMETTTKVGRRGGAGGKTSQTTTTKKETKTTSKGGERKTSTRTTTTTKGK